MKGKRTAAWDLICGNGSAYIMGYRVAKHVFIVKG